MAKYVHPNMIVDSSAAFLKNVTFDSSVYFQGVTHINAPAAVSSQTPFALVLESGSGTDLQVKSVQLGTMAKENATSWDASLSAIRTDIGNLETSVGALDTLTQSHTTQLGIHNASIGVLTSLTAVHDSSLGFLNAYRLIQDASIEAVGGAWKPYVDGSLATRDSSIIALFAKNAAQDASIIRIDASLNDTVELFDVIDASLQELWNYNAIQDASIALAISGTTSAWNGLTRTDNSIGLGGTLSQDTVINTSAFQLGVLGSMQISGDLTVDGSITYINTTELDVSDNIIQINTGLTGTPPVNMVSGMKVNRGSEDPYFFIFSEADDTFRIGIANESGLPTGTQAVATREDTPEGFGIPFWNAAQFRLDTSAGFEFTPGVGLSLPIATNDPAEATALMITPAGLVVSRELGTMAFAIATDYTLKTLFDSSVAAIWAKLGSVDTSIAGLDSLTQNHTTKINNLESSVGALDLLTQSHTQSITDLSTGKLDAVASTTSASGHQIYSTEVNNVAYVKKLVAGTGVSMTSDSSIITISADLTSGVLKYKGTFNGTSSTSLSIPAATHTLGTGPLSVTVYDGTQQVYVDVDCAANGDITLEWTGGSLSASCKYIIMG